MKDQNLYPFTHPTLNLGKTGDVLSPLADTESTEGISVDTGDDVEEQTIRQITTWLRKQTVVRVSYLHILADKIDNKEYLKHEDPLIVDYRQDTSDV